MPDFSFNGRHYARKWMASKPVRNAGVAWREKIAGVLILTALNDEISIGRAFAAGATDYISKPLNFAVLQTNFAPVAGQSCGKTHP